MTTLTIIAVSAVFLVAIVFFLRWACKRCEAANEVDWGGRWLNRLDGLNRLFCRRYHRLPPTYIPLPEQGGALLASNHISGLDPMLMIASARRPLRFMIAREQYERFGLQWLFRAIGCIPVEREQRPEQALRHALRVLREGEVVALFPHGGIHLDTDPPRKLKRGVVKLAELAQCPIYPVRLEGIAGAGQVITAVILRSQARLTSFPPLSSAGHTTQECLNELARRLDVEQPSRMSELRDIE